MLKSKSFLLCTIFLLLNIVIISNSDASYITSFNKTTNDGVYTINSAQAAYLGVTGADTVAFFRVTEGNGTTFNSGDYFDKNSILNSITSNASSVLGIFNGDNTSLGYSGGFYQILGNTTVGDSNSYYEAVMFAFNSTSGSIVFKGTSTFNAGQTRGAADFIPTSSVPVPAAAWLLGSGLVGLYGLRKRAKI